MRVHNTMSRLYLFNPDHDLALANGSKTYEAPASARQFASDLACLPLWYADAGDKVAAPAAFRGRGGSIRGNTLSKTGA